MKTEREIQRAHDLLVGIVLKDIDVGASAAQIAIIVQAASVLCWILNHEHNPAFGNLLKATEAIALADGYELREEAP